MTNTYNFTANILKLSSTDDIKKLPNEWLFVANSIDVNGTCICNKKITKINYYYNNITDKFIEVGNKCKKKLSLPPAKKNMCYNLLNNKYNDGIYEKILNMFKYSKDIKKEFISSLKKIINNTKNIEELIKIIKIIDKLDFSDKFNSFIQDKIKELLDSKKLDINNLIKIIKLISKLKIDKYNDNIQEKIKKIVCDDENLEKIIKIISKYNLTQYSWGIKRSIMKLLFSKEINIINVIQLSEKNSNLSISIFQWIFNTHVSNKIKKILDNPYDDNKEHINDIILVKIKCTYNFDTLIHNAIHKQHSCILNTCLDKYAQTIAQTIQHDKYSDIISKQYEKINIRLKNYIEQVHKYKLENIKQKSNKSEIDLEESKNNKLIETKNKKKTALILSSDSINTKVKKIISEIVRNPYNNYVLKNNTQLSLPTNKESFKTIIHKCVHNNVPFNIHKKICKNNNIKCNFNYCVDKYCKKYSDSVYSLLIKKFNYDVYAINLYIDNSCKKCIKTYKNIDKTLLYVFNCINKHIKNNFNFV